MLVAMPVAVSVSVTRLGMMSLGWISGARMALIAAGTRIAMVAAGSRIAMVAAGSRIAMVAAGTRIAMVAAGTLAGITGTTGRTALLAGRRT